VATPKKWYDTIICISDLQEPFGHPDAYVFLEAIKKKYWINRRRSKVVNQGDEADFHNFGRWPTDPDGYGPIQEISLAQERLAILWSLFPEQDVCISNHTIRPLKLATQAGLPRIFLRQYSEFLQAPKGVSWRDTWIYNNILFEHGEGVSGQTAAIRKAMQNRMSTSIGHQHSWGGVTYSSSRHDTIWGMNTGCLIDLSSYAFNYATANASKGTLGTGVIVDNVPVFIPLLTKGDGRWIGRLPSSIP
jgi:hypothetical protein